uniref:Helitron helicase-like domain-containing protein n=1 Tax=Bracon brevicornis TaxID=1563983 RepID=A0A6V7JIB9_9HYME
MAQNYQDAMIIVRKYDTPDLSITMTCNPNWRKMKETLEADQQACDRPDLVVRTFNLKKDALLKMIKDKEIFGKVKAFVCVIEFQKRGLPHMHLLVTLQRNYKITSPEIVDKFISAGIPSPKKDPELFIAVMKDMIHGPCGDWCFKTGECSKKFPKTYRSQTVMDEDGYPFYRRKNTGLYYERPGGYVVDNRFVVPYSPILLRKFNCHINVEVVSSIKAVKYVSKYIYEGHDALQ